MKILVLTVLLLLSSTVFAQKLRLYASDNPPINYLDKNGKAAGHSVEIVEELMKRVGDNSKIEIVPWARGYLEIQRKNNVALFTMTRNEEREKLFKWVGPLLVTENVLIKKKTNAINVSTVEDAKKVKAIGTVRGESREKTLLDLGFDNLENVTQTEQNIHKLMADRIDLMVISNLVWRQMVALAGLKPDDFEETVVVDENRSYLAFSKETPDEIISKWNDAYAAMVKDGTVKKILNKWLPGANAESLIKKYIK